MEHAGNAVDGVGVGAVDDRTFRHVREQGDLPPLAVRKRAIRPAQKDVGLNAYRAQLLHRMLGRLRLELAGRTDEGHEGEVQEQRPLLSELDPHLPNGLEEGQ